MTNAWGASWGTSWGTSWTGTVVPSPPQFRGNQGVIGGGVRMGMGQLNDLMQARWPDRTTTPTAEVEDDEIAHVLACMLAFVE